MMRSRAANRAVGSCRRGRAGPGPVAAQLQARSWRWLGASNDGTQQAARPPTPLLPALPLPLPPPAAPAPTILEEHDGGDAADAVVGGHLGALVSVQLELRAGRVMGENAAWKRALVCRKWRWAKGAAGNDGQQGTGRRTPTAAHVPAAFAGSTLPRAWGQVCISWRVH